MRMLVSVWVYALLSTSLLLVVVMAVQAWTRVVRRMRHAMRRPAAAVVEQEREDSAAERVLAATLHRS